ncbi:MAG TPA: glycosyltransferase family 2 protein [Terracidiphilus sp.]|nr:glycosyltransferase family 2 protein [Terracidiphilus sp.]
MNLSGDLVSLIVPTYNAARCWKALQAGISIQRVRPNQVIILDSSSTDGTDLLALEAGFQLIRIEQCDFDHGATRQLGADYSGNARILIYLTQDAVPSNAESFSELLKVFRDPRIGAAFGRQLPRREAGAIEAHARIFNYPETSLIRSLDSRDQLGFKSIFFSNSFAAYRREALLAVGGFPSNAIFGEDTIVTARMHLLGWKTAYVAEACVHHSHNYSIAEEFRRYFDIGALHSRERWLVEEFGNAKGEGIRFVRSEMAFLLRRDRLRVPVALARTIAKYLGYKIGSHERRLTARIKRNLGQNRQYWNARRKIEADVHTSSIGSVN